MTVTRVSVERVNLENDARGWIGTGDASSNRFGKPGTGQPATLVYVPGACSVA
jgi:hypothetical protein